MIVLFLCRSDRRRYVSSIAGDTQGLNHHDVQSDRRRYDWLYATIGVYAI